MSQQAIITIGDKQWQVDIAATPWELMRGLGGLAGIPPWTGMLFDVGATQTIEITTEDMLFPIDIAFLSEAWVVAEVYRGIEPGYIVASPEPARCVLEVNAGELEGVGSGDEASVEFLPGPAWLPEIPWETVMAVVMGSVVMLAFIMTIIRSIEYAVTPPKENSRPQNRRDETLLPQTRSTLPPEVSEILLSDPVLIPLKFDLPKGRAMPRTPEQSERIVDLALKANWGAEQVALTHHHPAWNVVRAFEDLMSDEEFAEYQRRKRVFHPQNLPQVEPVENEAIGLPIPFARAGVDWMRWETTLADKTVTVEVSNVRGLTRAQLEAAFARSTAWVPYLAPGQRLPFTAAARRHVWWLATIDDRSVEVHAAGIRGLTEAQLEEAFADSVAVMDVGRAIAVHPHATAKPQKTSKRPAVIPVEPRPRRPREELEFLPDSPEVIAQTIDAIGYREQIDSAFMEAIKRAKGLI